MSKNTHNHNNSGSEEINRNHYVYDPVRKTYECLLCDQPAFNRIGNLKRHILRHYGVHERYYCPYFEEVDGVQHRCSSHFQYKEGLSMHIGSTQWVGLSLS